MRILRRLLVPGVLALAAAVADAAEAAQPPAAPPAIVETVVVHGNHTTPDADVLALAGDVVGREATDALVAAMTERLTQSGRFAGVDVRRRFLSIDDPTRVLLVVVVDEHAGVSEDDLMPGPMKRLAAGGMWLPVLEFQEGYGFTYGARLALVETLGPRSRISAPLTWGGERQAQVEVERGFGDRAWIRRVAGGGGVSRRTHPFYDVSDRRQGVWGRVESAPRLWLRAGAGARVADVAFGGVDNRLSALGADLIVDTRKDPALPRNAVYVALGVERLGFDVPRPDAPAAGLLSVHARRLSVDARGYLGLVRQAVLAVRGQSVVASQAMPPFEKQILGGIPTLRGYDVGTAVGDNLAAVSAEVLLPLTSPLNLGRLGVKVFADGAAVYAAGTPVSRQRLRWGYGGGVFVNATILNFGVDVAWREGGGRPNAHVQLGIRLSR